MNKPLTFAIRLIPISMQVLGLFGAIYGSWYSSAMILGAGIGSQDGAVDSSYYAQAGWVIGIPSLVFLVGWVWVTVGFLVGPKRSNGAD